MLDGFLYYYFEFTGLDWCAGARVLFECSVAFGVVCLLRLGLSSLLVESFAACLGLVWVDYLGTLDCCWLLYCLLRGFSVLVSSFDWCILFTAFILFFGWLLLWDYIWVVCGVLARWVGFV